MANGWLELFPMQMIMFADAGLAPNSSDRTIWRFAQTHNMLLLTNNRSSHEANSLELTILEENTPTALPVLTIGNVERMRERNYREKCAERMIEVFIELDNYLGTGRIFIP
jgi:predicted nuclease of predicted toxin-antitoxin system